MSLEQALQASRRFPPRARCGGLTVENTAPGLFNLYGNTNPGVPFAIVTTGSLLGYLQSIGVPYDTGWYPE